MISREQVAELIERVEDPETFANIDEGEIAEATLDRLRDRLQDIHDSVSDSEDASGLLAGIAHDGIPLAVNQLHKAQRDIERMLGHL